MRRFAPAASLFLGGLFSVSCMAVTPVHKCEVNGSVTYQRDPCPSADPAPRPTLEQLNAERKRRAASAAAPAARPASAPREAASPTPATEGRSRPAAAPSQAAPAEARGGFKCDGRKYCSQMTSCAEAKYFLANCPGVKMDGDHNGLPCERQWCNP